MIDLFRAFTTKEDFFMTVHLSQRLNINIFKQNQIMKFIKMKL